MDPISLTASIFSVLQIAGSVGKGLRRLRDLRYLSDDIHGLGNAVSDFQAVLLEVDRVVVQHQATAHLPDEAISSLLKTVNGAKHHLLELDSMAVKCGEDDAKFNVSKLNWIRIKTRASVIQERLRDAKVNLLATLGTLCS